MMKIANRAKMEKLNVCIRLHKTDKPCNTTRVTHFYTFKSVLPDEGLVFEKKYNHRLVLFLLV